MFSRCGILLNNLGDLIDAPVDLITQLGNVPEDTVLTTSADVMACAFAWNIAKEEFTEIVQKRNAEIN